MSIPSWARPGVKVVCVDDGVRPGLSPFRAEEALRVGGIYTIARVFIDHYAGCCVHLNEVSRCESARVEHGPDVGYFLRRFRPLVTKFQEDDVALFTHLLHSTPESVDA